MLIEDIKAVKDEAKAKIKQLKDREKQSNILLKTLQNCDEETIKITMQKHKELQKKKQIELQQNAKLNEENAEQKQEI